METTEEMIGPIQAIKYLERNTDNYRRLSEQHVGSLAEQMQRGYWHFTGDTIKFNGDGHLVDGQHRLAAIVSSGTEQRFLVVRGVEPDGELGIDRNKVRSLDLILHNRGYENARMLVTASRMIFSMDVEGFEFTNYVTSRQNVHGESINGPDAVMAQIQRCEGLAKSIEYVISFGKLDGGLPSRAILAAVHWLCSGRSPAEADAFIRDLITGAELPEDSPVLRIRRMFMENTGGGSNYHMRVKAALIFKAWNMVRRGLGVELDTKLSFKVRGKRREAFPKPI